MRLRKGNLWQNIKACIEVCRQTQVRSSLVTADYQMFLSQVWILLQAGYETVYVY